MSILNLFVTTEITETLFVARRSWTPVQHYYFKALLRALNSRLLDCHLLGTHETGFIQCRFGNARMRCFVMCYKNEITVIISCIDFDSGEFDPDDGLAAQAHDARHPLYIYNVELDNGRGAITVIEGDPELAPPLTNRTSIQPSFAANTMVIEENSAVTDACRNDTAYRDPNACFPREKSNMDRLSKSLVSVISDIQSDIARDQRICVESLLFQTSSLSTSLAESAAGGRTATWRTLPLRVAVLDGHADPRGVCTLRDSATPPDSLSVFLEAVTGSNNSATRRNGHVAAPPGCLH